MKPSPIPAKDGQESAWDYHRPARTQASAHLVVDRHSDTLIAESRDRVRVLATNLAPASYVPPEGIAFDLVEPSAGCLLS